MEEKRTAKAPKEAGNDCPGDNSPNRTEPPPSTNQNPPFAFGDELGAAGGVVGRLAGQRVALQVGVALRQGLATTSEGRAKASQGERLEGGSCDQAEPTNQRTQQMKHPKKRERR